MSSSTQDTDSVEQKLDQLLEQQDDGEDLVEKPIGPVHDDYATEHPHERTNTITEKRRTWAEFSSWCKEKTDLRYLSDLQRRHIGDYRRHLRENTSKGQFSILKNLERVKQHLDYSQAQQWVTSDLGDWNEHLPDVRGSDRERDNPLRPDRGEQVTAWIKEEHRFTRVDVEWTLGFTYCLRRSAIKALDKRHFHPEPGKCDCHDRIDQPHLLLEHRPDLGADDDPGLPLKNAKDDPDAERDNPFGERIIPLDAETAHTIARYIDLYRVEHDEPDKYGCQALLTTSHSPRISSLYRDFTWMTSPARYTGRCDCEFCRDIDESPTKRKSYKCEHSRGPHSVRHGGITRRFNQMREVDVRGFDAETLAGIAGTSPETLRDRYDHPERADAYGRIADGWIAGVRATE